MLSEQPHTHLLSLKGALWKRRLCPQGSVARGPSGIAPGGSKKASGCRLWVLFRQPCVRNTVTWRVTVVPTKARRVKTPPLPLPPQIALEWGWTGKKPAPYPSAGIPLTRCGASKPMADMACPPEGLGPTLPTPSAKWAFMLEGLRGRGWEGWCPCLALFLLPETLS